MSGKRKGLGGTYIDELYGKPVGPKAAERPAASEPAEATPAPTVKAKRRSEPAKDGQGRGGTKVRATVHLPSELFDQVRDAVVALSGPPLRMTLAGFAEAAFQAELKRLEKAHHDGKRFPERQEPLKGGRPIGS